jgi:hypothetical protein
VQPSQHNMIRSLAVSLSPYDEILVKSTLSKVALYSIANPVLPPLYKRSKPQGLRCEVLKLKTTDFSNGMAA